MKKSILGLPQYVFYIVCALLVIGIIIGSFCDFEISNVLSNNTRIGDLFQRYANALSSCLYPIAGVCIFKSLKQRNNCKLLSWGVLILAICLSIKSDLTVSGGYLRSAYGYVAGESGSFIPLALSFLTWVGKAGLVALIAYRLINNKNSNLLLIVGLVIMVGGIIGTETNEWLKEVGNRPRYKYLLTLENPLSEFKNWWQMRPHLRFDNQFMSWPSGHMTYASIVLCLPMIADVLKYKVKHLKTIFFIFAIIWIIIFGYNRIHMDAHFLSDVCFGVLITYCLYAITYKCISKALPLEKK